MPGIRHLALAFENWSLDLFPIQWSRLFFLSPLTEKKPLSCC